MFTSSVSTSTPSPSISTPQVSVSAPAQKPTSIFSTETAGSIASNGWLA